MNTLRKLPRRRFLRAAGGIAVGLPFLEAFMPRTARGQAAATRLVVVYSPNGSNNLPEFGPKGTGANFTLGSETSPLTPYKSKLLVLSGLGIEHPTGSGDQHTIGMSSMLTGRTPGYSAQFEDVATSVGGGWASGISVDQELAQSIGQATKYKSLQFGIQTSARYGNHPIARLSYAAAEQPISPEDSPSAAYTRLFSGTPEPTTPGMVDANVKRDKSVMDFVIKEFEAVSGGVPAADKQRLDQHVTMLREVERSLSVAPVANPGSCMGSPFSPLGDEIGAASFPLVAKQQRDLMVLALSCGLTRVASLQYSYARSLQTFGWLNVVEDHHTLSHSTSPGEDGQVELDIGKISLWYATELAELLKSLDSVNEGGATLLDNCLGWWCSDVSDGRSHSWQNLRAFLFGSAGGRIHGGQALAFAKEPHNKLHVTLLNAMGVPATTFGDSQVGSGSLAGVLK